MQKVKARSAPRDGGRGARGSRTFRALKFDLFEFGAFNVPRSFLLRLLVDGRRTVREGGTHMWNWRRRGATLAFASRFIILALAGAILVAWNEFYGAGILGTLEALICR